MAAPLTVKRNPYLDNRKKTDIKTPYAICQFLYELIYPALDRKKRIIIDVGCGDGRLSTKFGKHWKLFGIEKRTLKKCSIQNVKRCDFLSMETLSFGRQTLTKDKVALVISNPPFNNHSTGRKLIPEVFIKHIFHLVNEQVPVCMFVPMGFRLNQRVKSSRWKYFRDKCKAEITSIISLPLNTFPNVEFHCEILIWNLPALRPHYWIPEKFIIK